MEGSKVNLADFLAVAKRLVTDFGDHLIIIFSALCVLILFLFILCWYITKRRFNRAGHQVPGGVVKDYLDSLIQNSMALRSSLFRDPALNPEAPSVMSIYKSKKEDKKVPKSTIPPDVSALKNQLSKKEKLIGELEEKLKSAPTKSSSEEDEPKEMHIQSLYDEISELKKQREEAPTPAEGQDKLNEITEERNQLKEKIKEYEAIQHDLPNLEKLQEENDQLKKDLKKGQEEVAVAAPPTTEESSPEESPPEEEPKKDSPPQGNKDKSAEDLLDEFEKMLG